MSKPTVHASSVAQVLDTAAKMSRGEIPAGPVGPSVGARPPAMVHMCAGCTGAVACNYIRGRWLCEPCSLPALGASVAVPVDQAGAAAAILTELVDKIDRLDADVRDVVERADAVIKRYAGGPIGLLRTRKAS